MREQHDTVIVGAGQAGLAMSAVLQRHGREHVVLERRRVGERWRAERWDSLRFQFPNWSLQLPGYHYTGSDPGGFAHYSEIVRLIEDYAARTRAPVREHAEVVGLAEDDAGTGFVVSLADGSVHARRVVLATGPFQRPLTRRWPRACRRRCCRPIRPATGPPACCQTVLCSSSAAAPRAARSPTSCCAPGARCTCRSAGTGGRRGGSGARTSYWWLEKMGRFAQTIDSFPARRPPPSVGVTGVDGGYDVNVRQLAADGAHVVGRVADASGGHVAIQANANQILGQADKAYADFVAAAHELAAKEEIQHELAAEQPADQAGLPAAVSETGSLDLAKEKIATIIWATGYTYDLDWVKIPVLDNAGRPVQHRGVTGWPGLYFLRLHWMHTIKSGLLAGVGSDAEYLAEHIARTR